MGIEVGVMRRGDPVGIYCLLAGRKDGECMGEAGRSNLRTIPKGCGMG